MAHVHEGDSPKDSLHSSLLHWPYMGIKASQDYYYWSLLCSAILRFWAVSLHSQVIRVFEYPPKCCTYSTDMAGATWNCCRLGAFCVHHTPCHFMQSHIRFLDRTILFGLETFTTTTMTLTTKHVKVPTNSTAANINDNYYFLIKRHETWRVCYRK